jgi:5-methylcytosine-specific restriction endonuclease McrA
VRTRQRGGQTATTSKETRAGNRDNKKRNVIPAATYAAVLARDRCCRLCGIERNLHVHHINYRSQGGNDDPHNLIVLCLEHHDLVHSNKHQWQPLLRAYIWLLYVERRRMFLFDIKRTYAPAA